MSPVEQAFIDVFVCCFRESKHPNFSKYTALVFDIAQLQIETHLEDGE